MRISLTHFIGAAVLALGCTAYAADDTVLSPAKRQQSLERGKALVAAREVVPIAVDPFYSTAFAEAAAASGRVSGGTPVTTPTPDGSTEPARPTGPRTGQDLLQAIAKSLKPGGYIVVGGQPSLSFGQKRVKAGGILTITFEGSQYTLEVVTINRTSFTLRLNGEEFTRTIN